MPTMQSETTFHAREREQECGDKGFRSIFFGVFSVNMIKIVTKIKFSFLKFCFYPFIIENVFKNASFA